MDKVKIDTEQGYIEIDKDGYVLFWHCNLCYDIAEITEESRDLLVKLLIDIDYKGQ